MRMWQQRERRDFLITQQEALPALLHHTPHRHMHKHNKVDVRAREPWVQAGLNTCGATSPVLHHSNLQAANKKMAWPRVAVTAGAGNPFTAWVGKFSDPQFP